VFITEAWIQVRACEVDVVSRLEAACGPSEERDGVVDGAV